MTRRSCEVRMTGSLRSTQPDGHNSDSSGTGPQNCRSTFKLGEVRKLWGRSRWTKHYDRLCCGREMSGRSGARRMAVRASESILAAESLPSDRYTFQAPKKARKQRRLRADRSRQGQSPAASRTERHTATDPASVLVAMQCARCRSMSWFVTVLRPR